MDNGLNREGVSKYMCSFDKIVIGLLVTNQKVKRTIKSRDLAKVTK